MDKKLLAWYRFENETDLGKDYSDCGRDAKLCGQELPHYERLDGRNAVVLAGGNHGTSYLELPERVLSGVSDENGLTISTWVYCMEDQSPWERIFDFGKGQTGPYMFLTRRMRGVCFKNEDIPADAGFALEGNRWHHIAFTICGTQKGSLSSAGPRLYINGELCADGMISQTSSGNYKAYRSWLETFEQEDSYIRNYIGSSQYDADPDFAGAFSDFRIYQGCLQENEILELMCESLRPEEILSLAKDKYLKAPYKILSGTVELQKSLMSGKVQVEWTVLPEGVMNSEGVLADVEAPTGITLEAAMHYEGMVEKASFVATVLPKDQAAYELTIHGDEKVLDISDTLYGLFYEDINHAADGGIYAQMVQNFSFENFTFKNYDPSSGICGKTEGKIHDPLKYWFGSLDKARFCQKDEASYSNYIEVADQAVLYNHGYCDETMVCSMNLIEGETYRFSIWMKSMKAASVKVTLLDEEGKEVSNSICLLSSSNNTWNKYYGDPLVVQRSCKGQLRMEFSGAMAIDFVSLFPSGVWGASEETGSDTAHKNYEGNPNYRLRRDLVVALQELHPTFLRFPGGCISEGSYIWDNVYDWKDSVGEVEFRKENFNVWGYNMTMGLGYMEYFQLAEDLHATPLPVMACGVLCQARSDYAAPAGGELREKYIKNFTDLIDFAISEDFEHNEWAMLRKKMGHEAPFDLHYLGVGNENWGSEFYANFEIFYDRIQSHMDAFYPGYELHIISTAGAQADDDAYQNGWKFLAGKQTGKEIVPFTDGQVSWEEEVGFYQKKQDYMDTIVDEHYYRSNEYLLENADRYNYYYRDAEEKTSKVFVGEYASSDKNTLAGAIAEAAVMTGFERNSDVVRLAATAPLFNKVGNDGTYRWTPDAIWFDDVTVWRTPNYYVQQLFAKYIGKKLLATSFETYDQGEKIVLVPKGSVAVRVYGKVELKKLIVSSLDSEDVLFEQDFSKELQAGIEKLENGYFICQPEWKNYKVTVSAQVLEEGAYVAIATGIRDLRNSFDESIATMHEYVIGHPVYGTGLRVCKEGKEAYKMGDYSSSVYAGNQRKCYEAALGCGELEAVVEHGKKQMNCHYLNNGILDGELQVKLEAYNYDLYSSVTEDDQHVYIKLVNAHHFGKKCMLHLSNLSVHKKALLVTLTGEDEILNLPNVNRKEAEVVVPVESQIEAGKDMELELPSNSLSVLVLTKE